MRASPDGGVAPDRRVSEESEGEGLQGQDVPASEVVVRAEVQVVVLEREVAAHVLTEEQCESLGVDTTARCIEVVAAVPLPDDSGAGGVVAAEARILPCVELATVFGLE